MINSKIKSLILIFFVLACLLLSGCTNSIILHLIPSNADVLFVSNQDTGNRRKEIYSLDIESGAITQITNSDKHFFIIGIDQLKQHIVASCAVADTDLPIGLGDEDRRSLWIINLTSNDEFLLTDIQNHAEGDSFSPDGKWIVFFMRNKDETQSDIYKIKIDGTNLTQLTNTSFATEADPSWSHDGKHILFSYFDLETNRFVLKKMDPYGKNIELVYDDQNCTSTPSFPPGLYDACWSPDDQWIVCEKATNYSGQNFGSGIWHIMKIRSDGSEAIDLSLLGNHSNHAEYLPSFSSNGKQIVYGSLFESTNQKLSFVDLCIMDANSGISQKITSNPYSNMFPIWIN